MITSFAFSIFIFFFLLQQANRAPGGWQTENASWNQGMDDGWWGDKGWKGKGKGFKGGFKGKGTFFCFFL